MKKDVIYIDIEDDITSIISKVKAAEAKIVALVPPKRVGVLQSIVNLKLLQKAAAGQSKRVVLITNDRSLMALAAGVSMPVAKNLQSKPEVAPIAALQIDEEEVINGEEMPIGDIAATVGAGAVTDPTTTEQASKAAESSSIFKLPSFGAAGAAGATAAAKTAKTGKKGPSIPNFETFRKKLFLFGGLGVFLVIFLIWALAIAPKATITISAKTSPVDVAKNITLLPKAAASEPEKTTFKPNGQELKKVVSVDFDATGTKDIGERAKATLTVSNSTESDPVVVPAGTLATSASGQKFVTDAEVTVKAAKFSGGSAIKPYPTATVGITAVSVGPEYNIASQNYTVAGYEQLGATASAAAGGSKETVTVVTQADVDKAKQALTAQDNKVVKAELDKQFTSDFIVIAESFGVTVAQPVVAPAVGEQAKKAKLTLETTYAEFGLVRAEVKAMLEAALKPELKDNQSVYTLGDNTLSFSQYQPIAEGFTVKLNTTSQIGPKIDTKQLAKQLAGKRYGEVEQTLDKIPGVDKVDINFWPFWVNTVPAPEKVTIKFSVLNDAKR